MRFIVFGAGAVGGVLAAGLSAAGYGVTVIARGSHLAAIRRDGLRVRSPVDEQTHRLPAVAHPGEVDWRPGDAVLLTMKSMDTAGALHALAAHAPPDTPVVCVQNGVANEPAALRQFTPVYGVCVMFPAAHLTPGYVEAHSAPVPGILDIGRYPHGSDATAAGIAEAFRAAAFVSEPRADIMRWKYAKLLTNLPNAVQAVCGSVSRDAEVVAMLRAEGEAVLRAAGIPYVSAAEDRQRRGDILRIGRIDGRPRGGGSSWQSLTRGTGAIETDYLNGEIVLLGRLHGVTTPVNEYTRRLANRCARTAAAPGAVPLDEFMAGLAEAP